MFCSNARKAVSNVFVDYGDPFHINDVITTVLVYVFFSSKFKLFLGFKKTRNTILQEWY